MKVKVKGLVFAGFAAMIFAANAMAANEDKTVTSKAFTEATYAKKANLKQTIDGTSATASVDFPSVAAVAGLVGDSYTGTAPVSVDAQTHVITVDVADAIASGETGLTTGGQVHTALADKEDVSNKTQTVAATGSTSDDKYPSETAVRAAITASEQATTYRGDTTTITLDTTTNTFSATAGSIASGNTGLVNGGQVYTALADKEDVSNKTQTVAATGSTSDDKYPSETAVRAAITAAAGDYQTKSTTAQQVSDGAGGWQALTTTATPTQDSTTPFTAGGAYTLNQAKEDVSNKTQTVAATGSTDDDKYPSETAVRAAITAVETAAATAYQDRSEAGEAQYVADGNGGWEALTKDTTVTSGSSNPVTSDAVYNAIQNSTGGLTIPAQNTNVCTAQHPCALVDVAGTLHWYTMAQDGYAGGELGDAQ